MDPITSGLTILQVVQTIAQASALLLGYVASVQDADSSHQNLLDELRSIGGVLTTFMGIRDNASLPPALCDALSRLMANNGPLAKLQAELENLLPTDQESRKMGMRDKLKWPFKEKKAAAIVDKLKGYCGEITNILAIDTWMTLKEVKDGLRELKEDSVAQKVRENAEERRKFLQWMNPVSCDDKHATSHGQRNPGTGRWIFHADEYKTWNTSDCAFLWLNGQPGHGKTILASSIIDEIRDSGEAELQTLAFFYCNFRDDRTTSAAAVLRSLVVQFLQQSEVDWITKIREPGPQEGHFASLQNLWKQNHDAKPHPTDLGFLRKLLVEASKLVRRPVLVIDALDECKDYSDLVGHLVNLTEDARLRLFVTGRSEPDIRDTFNDLPTMSLKDSAGQMKADICAHITEQLKTQKRLSHLPDTLKSTILEKLLEKAGGMFRWVQCQLDELLTCKRRIDIEAALDNLPAGLNETYDRIIQAIKHRGRSDDQIAQSCLLWLAGTFTPLTLGQLNEAMMIKVGQSDLNPDLGVMDPMDIVTACGSLVTYNEKTSVVALSHYSVKEYLISRPNDIFKSISDIHARICKLLITYVLCDFVDDICAKGKHPAIRNHSRYFRPWHYFDVDDDVDVDVANVNIDHPLLSYAILGRKHLGLVSDEDPDVVDALLRLNSEFLRNTKKHRVLAGDGYTNEPRWLRADRNLLPLLFIPLEYGKPWMVESLVKQYPHLLDADFAPGWGSPLIFAIAKNPDYLSVLLKLGVDLNKLSSFKPNLYGQYMLGKSYAPISWAAATGSEVALDLLLSRMEVDIPNDILHMAIRTDKLSHESIRKIRQRGADVNFTVNGSTPIHSCLSYPTPYLSYPTSYLSYPASFQTDRRSLSFIKALIEPCCNLYLQDWTARTVLHIALDERLEDIVIYLLGQNAGLSATATLHPDMWSWAKNKTWFPKVQAEALAARTRGNVVDATTTCPLEFPVAVTDDRDNPHPICAIVVSMIFNDTVSGLGILAYLSYCNQSLQRDSQDSLTDDSLRVELYFSRNSSQRVSSRLLDHHQGTKVTRMLQQLTKDKDSTGTSLILQLSKQPWSTQVLQRVDEFTLDIYRGPVF